MKRSIGQKQQDTGAIGWWLVFLFVFIGELFAYAWCRVQCVETGYQITQAAEYHQDLLALEKNLRVELSRLKSPDRVAKIAKTRLGLVMPTAQQMTVFP